MNVMSPYAFAKIADINYCMAIHVGGANQRLVSQIDKILLIAPIEIPDEFRKQFVELHEILLAEHLRTSIHGVKPTKIRSIKNQKASKFIEMLYLIEHSQYDL